MTKRKKPSGAENLKAAGRVALLIGMTPAEREIIRVAAAKAGKSSSVWLRDIALETAKKSGK